MTPGARLQAAIELLSDIDATPRPADAVISAYFRARRYIGSKDRGAVAEQIYAVLRRHARLHWWLERNGHPADPRALVIVNAVVGDGREASEVAALFDGAKFSPAPFSPAETRLARAVNTHTLEHPQMPEVVRAECPAWAEAPMRAALGERFLPEMLALLEPAPLDLRVNPIKTDRATARARLKATGVMSDPTRWSPLALRVHGRPPLATLSAFQEGLIEIQDEGSQLVGLLADTRPGHQVVDFCAGAGGKALAMAARMNNKGRLVACDVLEGRLKRAAERFRRAGLHNIETRALSSERDPWVKRHKLKFDRVLCDAPCTGTGTWRRNPDSRWRPLGPGLVELVKLQAAILDSAQRLVKPGGRLIYATCSLLAEENESQMEAFLAAHPEFTVVPVPDLWPEVVGKGPVPVTGPYLRLTPARHDTDGFFAAILERAAAPVGAGEPEAPVGAGEPEAPVGAGEPEGES